MSPDLDPTDRALLRLLARDGRASYQALADQVGLSRPAAMERVRKLEERGVVRGYAAILDREKLGRPVTAFLSVRYAATSDIGVEPEIEALRDHPDVLECHHVAGEDCYILKVAAPTLQQLEQVIRALRERGAPVSTRTTIVLSTVFEKPGILPAAQESSDG